MFVAVPWLACFDIHMGVSSIVVFLSSLLFLRGFRTLSLSSQGPYSSEEVQSLNYLYQPGGVVCICRITKDLTGLGPCQAFVS